KGALMRRRMMLSSIAFLSCALGVIPAQGAGFFTFTTIDFPGATPTMARGLNSPGQIVGEYSDVTRKGHGFLLAAGSFATLDVPSGASRTVAFGNNNLGEIAGFYIDAASTFHGFVLAKGAFTTIDVRWWCALRAVGLADSCTVWASLR